MIYFLLRAAIGSVLLVSGFTKVIYPYQNFVYVIQSYQLLPGWAENLTAMVLPWIELIAGLFTILGLWTPRALRAALMLFSVFIIMLGQAILRGIPLDHCGCFGEWLQLRPQQVIVMDSMFLLAAVFLLQNLPKAQKFSLDGYFTRR